MSRIAQVSVSEGRQSAKRSYARAPSKHRRYTNESDECMFTNRPQTKGLHSRQELKVWLEKRVLA